jgi:hypothetical protein
MNRIAPGWNPASFLTPQHLQATPVNGQHTETVVAAKKTADDERTAEADAQAAFNSLQL